MNKKKKATDEFLWRVDTDQLEMLRRAKYDAGVDSINALITECVELGFPLFCEKHGIAASLPNRLKQEEPKLEDTIIENKDTFTIFHKAEDVKKAQDIRIKEKDLS
jgi:hypothetical protein